MSTKQNERTDIKNLTKEQQAVIYLMRLCYDNILRNRGESDAEVPAEMDPNIANHFSELFEAAFTIDSVITDPVIIKECKDLADCNSCNEFLVKMRELNKESLSVYNLSKV